MFPIDATTTQVYASNSISLGDITTNLTPIGNWTLLNWYIYGNSKTFVDIICRDNPTGTEWIIARMLPETSNREIKNDVTYQCENGDFRLVQRGPSIGSVDTDFVQITTIPRLTSTNMSTTTASSTFAIQDGYVYGTHYTYNPLLSLIGIAMITIGFGITIYAFFKLFRKS
jgi:hypothetical protein